jgi:predicted nucleotide-binding protein (sugar kinase/HSP70/actin superfamily)
MTNMTKCPTCGRVVHDFVYVDRAVNRYTTSKIQSRAMSCRKSIWGDYFPPNGKLSFVHKTGYTWRARAIIFPVFIAKHKHSNLCTLFCFGCGQVIETKTENIRKNAIVPVINKFGKTW